MSELLGGDAALRKALRAAAEQVDPIGDGLDKIRERVRHRRPMPLAIAWVDIVLTKLSLRVPDGFWVAWDRLALEVRSVSRHFLPDAGGGRGARSSRSWLGWARPIAAMSAATFLVAAVVYTAIEVPAVMSPVSGPGPAAPVVGQHPSSGGETDGGGQPQGQSPSPLVVGPLFNVPGSTTCPTKSPPLPIISTSPPASTTPTPPPSSTPSPSVTPSPSSTPSPSPSASDTPTGSPSDGSLAPADPSSGATGQLAKTASKTTTQDSTTTPRSTGGAKAHTVSASASPTPCASASPKPKPKPSKSHSTVNGGPAAAGPLTLWAGGAGLVSADVRAKLS